MIVGVVPIGMASRWRAWNCLSHVDSYVSDSQRELEAGSLLCYTRVNHTLSWSQFLDAVSSKALRLPPHLEAKVQEELSRRRFHDNKTSSSCYGSGRAELLHLNWNPLFRPPGRDPNRVVSDPQNDRLSDSRINRNTNLPETPHATVGIEPDCQHGFVCYLAVEQDWMSHKKTLYIKHLPSTLSAGDLKSVVESFGTVSNCEVVEWKEANIGFVEMDDPSTCDWVISYFQGRPYEDTGDPVECGFAADLLLL